MSDSTQSAAPENPKDKKKTYVRPELKPYQPKKV